MLEPMIHASVPCTALFHLLLSLSLLVPVKCTSLLVQEGTALHVDAIDRNPLLSAARDLVNCTSAHLPYYTAPLVRR